MNGHFLSLRRKKVIGSSNFLELIYMKLIVLIVIIMANNCRMFSFNEDIY